MPSLVRISQENTSLFKWVRLRALQTDPLAFGSTFAQESLLTDADWHSRSVGWTESGSIGLMAMEDEQPCGLAVCVLLMNGRMAEVRSMWVAPSHRRTGLGATLIEALRTWSAEQGASRMRLTVVNSNDAAIRFYERLGFLRTGVTEPYPNDPNLVEYEMILPLLEPVAG